MGGHLSLACMILAAGAAVVWWLGGATADRPGPAVSAAKTASTLVLALGLWSAAADLPALWPLALGMTLGAAGDGFLTRRGEAAFLAGMAAFGAGHLAYAGFFLSHAPGPEVIGAGRLAAALSLVALTGSTEVWLAPRTGRLRAPVRAYVLLIGLMGLSLLALPEGGATPWLWLGGGLFILSDLLLALRLFVVGDPARQGLLSRLLWPAYWGGQALIAAQGALLAGAGQG